ncbi:MAG TPA: hypothetical protein ENJ87_05700 [Gammaproteobacteria bacterium]|nr:hypothetical protein [Gammaproteobacteria bacterium]
MIAKYALVHCANEIPQSYYETMIKTWHEMNRQGHDWSQSNAAAALLHLAVVEGIIHISQLTPRGYKAIDWAKNFTRNLEAVAA